MDPSGNAPWIFFQSAASNDTENKQEWRGAKIEEGINNPIFNRSGKTAIIVPENGIN
jgi:hypothetical protein